MAEFIRLQYKLGRLTKAQLAAFVPRWLTAEEAAAIEGEVTVC